MHSKNISYDTRFYKMFFNVTIIDNEVSSVLNFSLAIPEHEHWHVEKNWDGNFLPL